MTATFVDTSYFLAISLAGDALHARAVAWKNAIRGPLITSEFVLIEVADDLSVPAARQIAASIIALVNSDPLFTVIPLSKELLLKGLSLFKKRTDKEWGLTDCISFEIMREGGVVDALTYDRHFEQAGFRALLRHEPPAA